MGLFGKYTACQTFEDSKHLFIRVIAALKMVSSLEAHLLGGMNVTREGTIINFLSNSRCTRGLDPLP